MKPKPTPPPKGRVMHYNRFLGAALPRGITDSIPGAFIPGTVKQSRNLIKWQALSRQDKVDRLKSLFRRLHGRTLTAASLAAAILDMQEGGDK